MTDRKFDATQCFVHIRDIKDDRFVEFDFAIGDPLCNLEMVLPVKAFEEFCVNNKVIHMSEEEAQAVETDRSKWSRGEDAQGRRYNF